MSYSEARPNMADPDRPINRLSHFTFPVIEVTSEPASTDSMITVRLSQPFPDLDTTYMEGIESESSQPDPTVDPTHEPKRLDSIDILHGNGFEGQDNKSTQRARSYSLEVSESDNNSFVTQHTSDSFSAIAEDDEFNNVEANPWRPRSSSSSSSKSHSSGVVDWVELEKTEEEEARDEFADDSTAFLLARLEQENNALATDPRFGVKTRPRKQSRPPTMQAIKRLVNDPSKTRSSRYSLAPDPPPMTELEFWAALVKDYPQTAQRLPTLTANKIKSGVPPPLRGVVWVSMAGARDHDLEEQFDKLVTETSPYENLIGKDIGRSFPGVEMFREADGEGQQMLARVLKSFSLYDKEIGYCQGLGFLVGPLLMQMGDKDAFCILVKLMENYDLRSCFLPDLSGLHLRIYQFKHLLDQHLPALAAHLSSLQVEAAYLTQWFLSFFAVTCPLPMLFRIYDVIFAEGASETIMRVALSLMKRNETRIMASHEFEEVMHLLLSRSLWEPYQCNADDLVEDFGKMNSVVTRESLKNLESSFKHARANDPGAWYAFLPDATSAASRFLGRLWTAGTPSKSGGLTPHASGLSLSRPQSFLRRSPSKQSISVSIHSTEVSSESTDSVGTVTTDPTVVSRDSSADIGSAKAESFQGVTTQGDKSLHGQIEDLLTALSDLQRQHSLLTSQLQREQEERSEDHQAFEILLKSIKPDTLDNSEFDDRRRTMQYSNTEYTTSSSTSEVRRKTMPTPTKSQAKPSATPADLQELVQRADERIQAHKDTRQLRSSLILETKQRLQESLARSREQLEIEKSRSAVLSQQLEDQEQQTAQARESLRAAQARIQEQMKQKESLERTIQDLTDSRSRSGSLAWSDVESPPLLRRTNTAGSISSITSRHRSDSEVAVSSPTSPSVGPRQRSDSLLTKALTNGQLNASSPIPLRTSSLATQAVLSTEGHAPATEDDLLLELVNVKTSEAVARQELEEVKAKLDAMRKMLGVESPPSIPTPSMLHRPSPSESTITGPSSSGGVFSSLFSSVKSNTQSTTNNSSDSLLTPPASSSPGSFWSWGKKSAATAPAKEISEVQTSSGCQANTGMANSPS